MRNVTPTPTRLQVRRMVLDLPKRPSPVPVQRHVLLPDGRRSRELAAGAKPADWEAFLMGGTLHLVGYLSAAA